MGLFDSFKSLAGEVASDVGSSWEEYQEEVAQYEDEAYREFSYMSMDQLKREHQRLQNTHMKKAKKVGRANALRRVLDERRGY